MRLITPAALALAALLPIIVIMYLLKLRRTERVVSSLYLWSRMVRDVEANAPWQRLQKNLLLIVQLLFLAFVVLALARPFTWSAGPGGQAVILVFDTSASMAATDVTPSRLKAAQAQAQRMVSDLPQETRVTVIAAGEGAQVLVASSRDRRQAHLAIEQVGGSVGGSDLTAAVEMASAIAARQPDTDIVIFSDGNVALPQRAIRGRVRYMPMGISGDNQAVNMLSLQPAPGGHLAAFVQVTNYGPSPARRRLTLYADGQPINAYDLELPAGGVRAVIADDLPLAVHILEARLGGAGDSISGDSISGDKLSGDHLLLDDRAWAVHRADRPAAVTLVTEGNLFLETALSLFANLQVTVILPADFESAAPAASSPDLTILDAWVPITAALPAGHLWFIAPPHSTSYFTVTGQVQQPMPRPVGDDPLLTHVNLSQVSILEAARLALPSWARPVIAGDMPGGSMPGGSALPLLFVGETEGRRIVVLTFDLHRSDLPLNVAFPLLLANLLGWLAPGGSSDLPTQIAPGTPVALALSLDIEQAQVAAPDGRITRLSPEGGQAVFADTTQLGVYRLVWGDQEAAFAVNLFAPCESAIQPAASLPLIGQEGAASGDQVAEHRSPREWWRLLAWIALALFTAEWLIYQRAALFRLWQRAQAVWRRPTRPSTRLVKR